MHIFENLAGTEEEGKEIPKAKPQKRLLLRSVLGGAAAVGLLFMIMHLRFVFDPLFVPGSADSISPSI